MAAPFLLEKHNLLTQNITINSVTIFIKAEVIQLVKTGN